MMRNLVRAVVLIIFILAGVILLRHFSLPPIKVRAAINRRSALVGDRIRYSIKIITDTNIDVDIPEVLDRLDGFEVLDEGLTKKKFLGKNIVVKWYLLTLYQPGDYVIPGLEIAYRHHNGKERVLSTRELGLSIKSISDDQTIEASEIAIGGGLAERKIKGKPGDGPAGPSRKIDAPIFFRIKEVKEPIALLLYADLVIPVGIVAIIVILGLIFLIVMKQKKRREPVRLPPREEAIKRLNELEAKKLPENERLKEFYFELSSILRQYLNACLTTTGEITTEEFFNEIDKMQEVSSEVKSGLKNLLSMCDRIKYSGQIPENHQWRDSLKTAKSMFEMEAEKV